MGHFSDFLVILANLCGDHQRLPSLGRTDSEKGVRDDENAQYLPTPNEDAKMNWDPLLLYHHANV